MKKLDSYEISNLMIDAKTLEDISRVLRADDRYKALPDVLNEIASDIRNAFGGEQA